MMPYVYSRPYICRARHSARGACCYTPQIARRLLCDGGVESAHLVGIGLRYLKIQVQPRSGCPCGYVPACVLQTVFADRGQIFRAPRLFSTLCLFGSLEQVILLLSFYVQCYFIKKRNKCTEKVSKKYLLTKQKRIEIVASSWDQTTKQRIPNT